MACRRGALIVLEGVDRAGKTTQCKKLVQALQQCGQRAEMLRFPDRTTEIGQLINSYLEKKSNLEDHTIHLLFSANRWEQVPLIKEKLEQGVHLIVDRYAFSGVAFTSAKPLSPMEAARRGQFGVERYENTDFQKAVQARFQQLMRDRSVNWEVIDACRSVEDLHKEIKSRSKAAMDIAACQPIGELWK